MKKYTIGEVLSKFKSVEQIAFCVAGETKGVIVAVDMEEGNNEILVNFYPDGRATYDFNIRLGREFSDEDKMQWIFMDELSSDDDEYEEVSKAFSDTMTTHIELRFESMLQEEVTELENSLKKILGELKRDGESV